MAPCRNWGGETTQKRKSPRLRVGAASCPDQMPGDAVQKVDAVVKDLQGAVVVRG